MKRRVWLFLFLFVFCRDSWSDLTIIGAVPFDDGTLSFQVHGSKDQLETMNVVKKILEEDPDTKRLLNYFRYQPPQEVHFYVDGKARSFNGYAMPFPHNFIALFNSPPLHRMELTETDQWFKGLVLHELTHILHMDQTRGGWDILRSLFGSIVVPGAIVPRWVLEGAAVWAESRFTSFGRLNSPLFKSQLYWMLREGGFCREIGCLDDPGHYPYNGYPYWVGGFFLDFLEQKKPGTIRCLVEVNSSLFPFFINRAFKDCAGKGAPVLFDEFRREFVGDYERGGVGATDDLPPHWNQISWFSGTVLKGKTLFYVYWKEHEQFVGAYDFKSQGFRSWGLAHPIEGLSLQGETVVVDCYRGQDIRGKRLSYQLLGEDFVPTPPRDFLYQFETREGVVFLDYHASRWILSNDLGKEYRLPRGFWIVHPELHQGKVYFKLIREGGGVGQVVALDPKSLQIQGLYTIEKGGVSLLGSCGDSFYFLEGAHPQILLARFSSEGVFVLEKGGPRFYDQNCRDYLKGAGGKGISSFKLKKEAVVVDKSPDKRYQKPSRVRPYLSFGNLAPRYWLLYGSFFGDLSFVVAQTQLTDPRGTHSFDPLLRYYIANHRYAPELTYTYSPRSFVLGGGYGRSYYMGSWSSGDGKEGEGLVQREGARVFVGYEFLGDEVWSYTPMVFLSQRVDEGVGFSFYGKSQQVVLDQSLFRGKWRMHQWLNHFFLRGALGYHRGSKSRYWFGQAKVAAGLNIGPSLRFRLNGGHSRVLRSNSQGGLLFGGDVESADDFHPFHGIASDGLYGQAITSGGVNLYHRLATPYSQGNFFPLQWQEMGGVLGVDSVHSDQMLIGDKLYRKQGIAHSYYGGMRFRVKVFYGAQIDWDMLVFAVQRDGSFMKGTSLFLSGEF